MKAFPGVRKRARFFYYQSLPRVFIEAAFSKADAELLLTRDGLGQEWTIGDKQKSIDTDSFGRAGIEESNSARLVRISMDS